MTVGGVALVTGRDAGTFEISSGVDDQRARLEAAEEEIAILRAAHARLAGL